MRYSQIRAFHYVALYGGFSRAAEVLRQTQPSLSDQVRKLEREHDTLLFHRESRRIRLTRAGDTLFLLTRQFFEVEDALREQLDRSRAAISGRLRIVADSAIHVTDAVRRFRQAHPGVLVSIQTGNTEEVLQRLRNYDAEIGVVGNLDPAADLDSVYLGSTPIIAIAASGILPPDVVSLDFCDLHKWPLVFRESGSRTRQSLEAEAQRQKMTLRPVIEVDGREAMREVVASGAGLGFVSEAEAGPDPRLVHIPIIGISLPMRETLVTLTMRRDVPVIRAFRRTLSPQSCNAS